MDAVRRGTVGVALFISGLFAMPTVAALDLMGHDSDATLTATPEAAATPVAPRAAARPPAAVPARLSGFRGVHLGARLSGPVKVGLFTTGDVGYVEYTIKYRSDSMTYTAYTAPWVFAPDGSQWDTRRVPNGAYTLIAQPYDHHIAPISIRFWVDNSASANLSDYSPAPYQSYLP